jgi:hypothetical protein
MSLNEIKKEFKIAGKGHNEILRIVNQVEDMHSLAVDVRDHVPEKGGT